MQPTHPMPLNTLASLDSCLQASNVKHTVAEKMRHKSGPLVTHQDEFKTWPYALTSCEVDVGVSHGRQGLALKVSASSSPSGLVHNPLPLEQALHLGHVLLHVSLGQLLGVGVQGLQILLPERRLRLLLLGNAALCQSLQVFCLCIAADLQAQGLFPSDLNACHQP